MIYDSEGNLVHGKIRFDVVVDGRLIFSKHEVDRFPTDGEILDQLKS